MNRDYLAKPCPSCGAEVDERCITISGNWTSQPHAARWLEPGTYRERHVGAPYRRHGAKAGPAGAEHEG